MNTRELRWKPQATATTDRYHTLDGSSLSAGAWGSQVLFLLQQGYGVMAITVEVMCARSRLSSAIVWIDS